MARTSNFKDLSGQKFGRLTVIRYYGRTKWKRALWECLCDCGNVVIARTDSLKDGAKQSCGCLNSENKSRECKERNTTHGMSKTRLYRVWCDMRRRCNDIKTPEYKNYGARGIKVCKEWESDFLAFYKWSMANGYDENAKRFECTIDRIDVNGNYSPDNCRFVDIMVQASNKRNNRWITHNGETKTQSEWGRYYGKDPSFFCDAPEIVEKKMNGCDVFLKMFGEVPPNVHCVKLSQKYARRHL